MSWLNFWKKKPEITSNSQQDTYIDIIISLTRKKQIDFSIYINDSINNVDMNTLDYALLCGEFLNTVIANKMKDDTIEILNKQIKTPSNELLINNIVSLIRILDRSPKKNNNEVFIKPSDVFRKYI